MGMGPDTGARGSAVTESWREAVLRHAPPYAVGTRVWTVVGHHDDGRTARGHYTEPEAAIAAEERLLAEGGWRVATMLPA